MIDAPGPWGTGPFTLVEGYSSLDNQMAVIRHEPLAGIWLQTREERTPNVRLRANTKYWDKARGPFLEEVVFRNDLSPAQALELVCGTEGEVDIVTNVSPVHAARVKSSQHAKLVSIEGIRLVAGVINRGPAGLPFADRRARQALNHAVDRDRLVKEVLFGHGEPLAGLTPSAAVTFVHRLSPYKHDQKRAAELWREAGGLSRPLRIAAAVDLEAAAQQVAANLRDALGIESAVRLCDESDLLSIRRRLAEKNGLDEWDIFLQEQGAQAADAPPIEFHRAFVGETGELRAGPAVPEFDALYSDLPRHTTPIMLAQASYQIDKFVHEEALALFLYSPHSLYAVNQAVDFRPYRSTFELADCKVSDKHWSVRNKSEAPS